MRRLGLSLLPVFLATACGGYAGLPYYEDRGGPPLEPGDSYERAVVNPFTTAAHDPFSTFAADVDTASYDIFVRDAQDGLLPSPDSVRLEDYVNAFDYDYPAPAPDAEIPFAIDLVAGPHPFREGMTELRVGIQAADPPDFVQLPTNLVYLVDTSGSMDSADKLGLAKELMRDSLDQLAATDTVSIVTYAGSVAVRLPPTPASERTRIENAIAHLGAGGGTAGASGIRLAYDQAEAGFIEGGFNHVVLMTDGDFNIGISDTDALVSLIEEERETGVTLTALGFGRGNLNDAMMERVSNAGNGVYSVITSERHAARYAEEDLLRTAHHVAQDMKIQVEFNPDHVLAYRLLGYSNRVLAYDDFRDDAVDAGEVGAGYRVTALYEVVLAGGTIPEVAGAPAIEEGERVAGQADVAAEELVRVRVRWKALGASAEDPASETAASLSPGDVRVAFDDAADRDFLWASAMVAFGEVLAQSPYAQPSDLALVGAITETQADRDEDRALFAELFPVAERGVPGR